LLGRAVEAGHLQAVADPTGLVSWADASIVCVGTPSDDTGRLQLDALLQVSDEIGGQLAGHRGYHVVVVRSTVVPGTVGGIVRELLESRSGRVAGRDFGLAMNPEFLREASAVSDYNAPAVTIVGALDERSGALVEALHAGIDAPVMHVSLEQAEMIKLAGNAFHALKVGFANEIARLCGVHGIDAIDVMAALCADTRLNISPAYLRPGFAFGGPCLPKDLRAVVANACDLGVDVPILDGILRSNSQRIADARADVHRLAGRRVAILGLSFKPHSNDVRESPLLELARLLAHDSLDVVVYDPDVCIDSMPGGSRFYLEQQLPGIRAMTAPTLRDAVSGADVIVIGHARPEFQLAAQSVSGAAVIDLTGSPALASQRVSVSA
jgi:GDP-mannose 6-dehydrogenase